MAGLVGYELDVRTENRLVPTAPRLSGILMGEPAWLGSTILNLFCDGNLTSVVPMSHGNFPMFFREKTLC